MAVGAAVEDSLIDHSFETFSSGIRDEDFLSSGDLWGTGAGTGTGPLGCCACDTESAAVPRNAMQAISAMIFMALLFRAR
jgi:hypothetical protein